MNEPRPPLRWRVFAVFMVVSVLPYETIGLLWVRSAYDAIRYVVDSIGTVGLVGYAFDRRIGPPSFWRMFAPVFVVFSVAVLLVGMAPLAVIGGMAPGPPLVFVAIFLTLAVAVISAISLALLRYGDLVQGGRPAAIGE